MESVSSGNVFGYARVSSKGQHLDYQLGRLAEAGCTIVFHEKRSGKSRDDRPELARVLNSLRKGDTLFATVSDRVARDPIDLLNIVATVRKAGARLCLIDEPMIDTDSDFVEVVLVILGYAAKLQRIRILENTAHGRELARKRGVKFGRKPKLCPSLSQAARERVEAGESYHEVAAIYGVSESTLRRLCRFERNGHPHHHGA